MLHTQSLFPFLYAHNETPRSSTEIHTRKRKEPYSGRTRKEIVFVNTQIQNNIIGVIQDIVRCHICNTTETPEWRKGPAGPRTLCNACGLRYAKQQKKTPTALLDLTNEYPQAEKIHKMDIRYILNQ